MEVIHAGDSKMHILKDGNTGMHQYLFPIIEHFSSPNSLSKPSFDLFYKNTPDYIFE